LDHEVTETVDTDGVGPGPRTLSVVGVGRAGSALAVALTARGWKVAALSGRSREGLANMQARLGARVAGSASVAAAAARVTLLTVPDSQVTPVAAQIAASGRNLRGRVIAHTAASLGVDALAALRQTGAAVGSLHPLQALAGADSAELLGGSFFLVDGDAEAQRALRALVEDLGGTTLEVAPQARPLYHAAAVLAGNAPLALLERAAGLLVDAGVDPRVAHVALARLLEGAARNARRSGPASALTGPVVRGDAATIAAHLEALAGDADARDLYVRLSREMLDLEGVDGREAVAAALSAADAPPRPRIARARVA